MRKFGKRTKGDGCCGVAGQQRESQLAKAGVKTIDEVANEKRQTVNDVVSDNHLRV